MEEEIKKEEVQDNKPNLVHSAHDVVGFNKYDVLAEALYQQRKEAEEKETPKQFIGTIPAGGSMKKYVKDKYMRDELKKFCKELFAIYNQKFVVERFEFPYYTEGEQRIYVEYWVRCDLNVESRISGNVVPGVGAALVKTVRNTGAIVNFRHDCVSAETSAIKDAAKNFGIAADIYGKDVTEISEELQSAINKTLEWVSKKQNGDEKTKLVIEKIESLKDEESIFDYLREITGQKTDTKQTN